MKNNRRIIILLVALLMVAVVALPVFAAEYLYKVTIYAGNMGTIDGGSSKVFTDLKPGDRVEFDPDSVTLTDPDYYVKGIRESGRDNSEVGLSSFEVTRDMDLVVAYGILGDPVEYTTKYQDKDGKELESDGSYVGNAGDKPVIAFKYIEGYQPQYYNLTGTLAKDKKNVFTFVYYKIETDEEETSGSSSSGNGTNPSAAGANTSLYVPFELGDLDVLEAAEDNAEAPAAPETEVKENPASASTYAVRSRERQESLTKQLILVISLGVVSLALITVLIVYAVRTYKRKA